MSPFSEAFSHDANTLARPLVGALSLVEYWESEVRPKKSRAVLKEISPALGEAMVPGCEDDAAGAARAARIGLRWRLHDKVHLGRLTARIHTAPSRRNYFLSTGSRFQRSAGPSDDLQHQLHRVPHWVPPRGATPLSCRNSNSDTTFSPLAWPAPVPVRPL